MSVSEHVEFSNLNNPNALDVTHQHSMREMKRMTVKKDIVDVDTGERLNHKMAFEYYYALGSERSLHKVAEHVKVNAQTVGKWSTKFGWKKRIKEYDAIASEKIKEMAINDVVSEKARYRKLIQAMIGQCAKDVRDGKLSANSIADLERLVKLDLLLMGESTEVQTVKQGAITEEDRRAVYELANAMRSENTDYIND